jgi:hypothetical protein
VEKSVDNWLQSSFDATESAIAANRGSNGWKSVGFDIPVGLSRDCHRSFEFHPVGLSGKYWGMLHNTRSNYWLPVCLRANG